MVVGTKLRLSCRVGTVALAHRDTNVSQKLAATLDDILLVGGKVLLVQFSALRWIAGRSARVERLRISITLRLVLGRITEENYNETY